MTKLWEEEKTPQPWLCPGRGAAPQKIHAFIPACGGEKGARASLYGAEFLAANFFLSKKRNKIRTDQHITHKAYLSLHLYKPCGSLDLPLQRRAGEQDALHALDCNTSRRHGSSHPQQTPSPRDTRSPGPSASDSACLQSVSWIL